MLCSRGPFVFSRRRVLRGGVPVRPDVARPRPEQSFVRPDFLQDFFVIPVLFGWYLGLGNVAFYVVAIVEVIPFGMKTRAHLFAARSVNSVATIFASK